MKAKDEKTNVMRVLDSKKIKYQHYYYGDTDAISGTDVAKALGQNPECVFKTLVTEGKTKNHYVFIVPVEKELDLKIAKYKIYYNECIHISNLLLGRYYGEWLNEKYNSYYRQQ